MPVGEWFKKNPGLTSTLVGSGLQVLGGVLGSRQSKKEREQQQRQFDAQQQQQRDLSGRRGWDVVDPLLGFASEEARRVYEDRLAQGNYASNVPRPSSGQFRGASGDATALAQRAKDLALAGPGQGGQAGLDYVSGTLGGGGPAGGAGDYYRRSAELAEGLPRGAGAGMYRQAFDAAQGDNQYVDPIFGLARSYFGSSQDGGGTGGGGGGGGVSAGSVGAPGLDPNAYNINPDDPRFAVDPQGFNIDPDDPRFTVDPMGFDVDVERGLLGAPDPLDSQGFVQGTLGSGAPVGSAAHIRGMLADPFAQSNPQLENMVRLQQEDLERAHQSSLGDLNAAAGNLGAYGGSDFQLARAQMAGELGRNVERAGTGLRFEDYNRRIADQMQALGLGTGLDQAAMAQAAQMELANRADLTDRQKADLSAIVARQLSNQGIQGQMSLANQGTALDLARANQGTQGQMALANLGVQSDLARSNQGTQAGLAQTGASLGTQAAIANQSAGLRSSIANQEAELQREALAQERSRDALNAMLGAAGLQNDAQLGRLGLMGNFAGGMGGLEQAAVSGVAGAGAGLGGLEMGSLGAVPGLQGIEMGQLGQASGMVGAVDAANARAASERAAAQRAWQQQQLQWDYNRQAQALNDMINQGLSIGSHITTPTGAGYIGGSGLGGGSAGLGVFGGQSGFPRHSQALPPEQRRTSGGGRTIGFHQSPSGGRALEDSLGGGGINALYGGQALAPGYGATLGSGGNPYGLEPSTWREAGGQILSFLGNPLGTFAGNLLGQASGSGLAGNLVGGIVGGGIPGAAQAGAGSVVDWYRNRSTPQ